MVYCHPVPESFCASIRDSAIEVLKARGWEVRLLDLYAENFDPVMGCDERRSYNDRAPQDPALKPHFELLAWAEAILFVYPTWWYGLPAMLKGWLVITTCGAPTWWSVVVGQPGRKTLLRGMRALCATRCKTFFLAHYLMDASTPKSRAAFLAKVRARLERF